MVNVVLRSRLPFEEKTVTVILRKRNQQRKRKSDETPSKLLH
jgi:hypothetical protein